MPTRTTFACVRAGLTLVLVAAVTHPGALNARNFRLCGNHTIEGAYGIQVQGTRPVPENLGGGTEAFVGVVMRTYDGRGRFEQVGNVRGAVTGMPVDVPGSGSYLVMSDCTGTASFQPAGPAGPTFVERLVIVRDGDEIRTITAPPGPVATGVHLRVETR